MRQKRNRVRVLILIILLIQILVTSFSCSASSIKIGFAGPFSGYLSDLGVSGRNGAELAVREINEAGGLNGRELILLTEDDEADPDMAVQADQALLDAGAVAIIGHMTSSVAAETVRFANQNDIFMISPTISTDTLTGIDDNFFRIVYTSEDQARLLVDYAVGQELWNFTGFFETQNTAFSRQQLEFFQNGITSSGGVLEVIGSFRADNFSAIQAAASQTIETEPDAAAVFAPGLSTALFCQFLEQLGSTQVVLTSSWAMTDALIRYGGTALDRIRIAGYFIEGSQQPEYRRFREKYEQIFHQSPGFASVYAYEAVQVLFYALQNTDSWSAEDLKQTIIRHARFHGLQSIFRINEYGDCEREGHIFTVEDGRFVFAENGR
ncbi:MAG: ABC transporter substrate-binding protein [Spirochaetia bacterium]